MESQTIKGKTVFISYCHKDTTRGWIEKFVEELEQYGIKSIVDINDLYYGQDLNYFMENIKKVDKVLILLGRTYTEKANDREGGVGTETQIISNDVYNNMEQTKFIPIVITKNENDEAYLPYYLESRYYIDFSDEKLFTQNIIELSKQIHEFPKKEKLTFYDKSKNNSNNNKKNKNVVNIITLKSEKRKEFFKILKKISIYIIALFIIFLILMILYYTYIERKKLLEPNFALEIENGDNVDINNKIFRIYNTGGKISNAKVEAYVHLVLDLQKGLEVEKGNVTTGFYTISFTDYYSERDIFYDYNENCFTISELGADKLFEFLQDTNNNLIDNDIMITDFAIQNYFKIIYYDIFNRKHEDIYEVSNNHDYYFAFGRLCRYFYDNSLIKINSIDEVDENKPVTNPVDTAESIVKEDDRKIFTIELEMDAVEDESTGYIAVECFRGADELLYNDSNLSVGFKEGFDSLYIYIQPDVAVCYITGKNEIITAYGFISR